MIEPLVRTLLAGSDGLVWLAQVLLAGSARLTDAARRLIARERRRALARAVALELEAPGDPSNCSICRMPGCGGDHACE